MPPTLSWSPFPLLSQFSLTPERYGEAEHGDLQARPTIGVQHFGEGFGCYRKVILLVFVEIICISVFLILIFTFPTFHFKNCPLLEQKKQKKQQKVIKFEMLNVSHSGSYSGS
jgi:hypothetical protein